MQNIIKIKVKHLTELKEYLEELIDENMFIQHVVTNKKTDEDQGDFLDVLIIYMALLETQEYDPHAEPKVVLL